MGDGLEHFVYRFVGYDDNNTVIDILEVEDSCITKSGRDRRMGGFLYQALETRGVAKVEVALLKRHVKAPVPKSERPAMRLASVVLKCVACKSKETRSEMPTEQPMCGKCFMPMVLDTVSARSR